MSIRWLGVLAVLTFLAPAAALAVDAPHDGSGTSGTCEACHKIHNATGGTLINQPDNNTACTVCHNAVTGPSAARLGLPWVTEDQAVPGKGGQQHRWDALASAPVFGASAPADGEMAKRIKDGRIQCAACHDPHADVKSFDPTTLHTSIATGSATAPSGGAAGMTMSLSPVPATAATKGYRVQVEGISGAQFRLAISHNAVTTDGAPIWWVNNGTAWIQGPLGSGTRLWSAGAAVALDDGANVQVTFTGTPATGQFWDFYVSYAHLRASNVADAMCLQCHAARNQQHAYRGGRGRRRQGLQPPGRRDAQRQRPGVRPRRRQRAGRQRRHADRRRRQPHQRPVAGRRDHGALHHLPQRAQRRLQLADRGSSVARSAPPMTSKSAGHMVNDMAARKISPRNLARAALAAAALLLVATAAPASAQVTMGSPAWTAVGTAANTSPRSGTFTKPATGSNRIILVAVLGEYGAAFTAFNNPPVVTYGQGSTAVQTATRVTSVDVSSRHKIWFGYFNEAQIGAAGNTTLQATFPTGSTPTMFAVYAAVYNNVDQTTPTNGAAATGSDTTSSTPAAGTVAWLANGMSVGITNVNTTTTIATTWPAAYTEVLLDTAVGAQFSHLGRQRRPGHRRQRQRHGDASQPREIRHRQRGPQPGVELRHHRQRQRRAGRQRGVPGRRRRPRRLHAAGLLRDGHARFGDGGPDQPGGALQRLHLEQLHLHRRHHLRHAGHARCQRGDPGHRPERDHHHHPRPLRLRHRWLGGRGHGRHRQRLGHRGHRLHLHRQRHGHRHAHRQPDAGGHHRQRQRRAGQQRRRRGRRRRPRRLHAAGRLRHRHALLGDGRPHQPGRPLERLRLEQRLLLGRHHLRHPDRRQVPAP